MASMTDDTFISRCDRWKQNSYCSSGQRNVDSEGVLVDELVQVRHMHETTFDSERKSNLMDRCLPSVLFGRGPVLIPFLEHDDALNRALMGSNMQRQAVPTLKADKPVVGTGNGENVAKDLWCLYRRFSCGVIESVDASRIVVSV